MNTAYTSVRKSLIGYVDTHCHLADNAFSNQIPQTVSAATEAGVHHIWAMSTSPADWESTITIANHFPSVESFIGIDPYVYIPESGLYSESFFSASIIDEHLKRMQSFIQSDESVFGIGEIGIDTYRYDQQKIIGKERDKLLGMQTDLFRAQLQIAEQCNKPVSIHSRGCEAEVARIVAGYSVDGIFHSFAGDIKTAHFILEMGNAIGINGIVTFKNANEIRAMFRTLMLARFGKELPTTPEDLYKAGFVIETDAPYLAPEGHRGERNEPKHIPQITDIVLQLAKN